LGKIPKNYPVVVTLEGVKAVMTMPGLHITCNYADLLSDIYRVKKEARKGFGLSPSGDKSNI
jgi:hypothetical protein